MPPARRRMTEAKFHHCLAKLRAKIDLAPEQHRPALRAAADRVQQQHQRAQQACAEIGALVADMGLIAEQAGSHAATRRPAPGRSVLSPTE